MGPIDKLDEQRHSWLHTSVKHAPHLCTSVVAVGAIGEHLSHAGLQAVVEPTAHIPDLPQTKQVNTAHITTYSKRHHVGTTQCVVIGVVQA